MRMVLMGCLLLLLGAGKVQASQAGAEIVGFGTFSSCSFALMSNGDIYSSVFDADFVPGEWTLVGNVFANAGVGGGSMAGVTFNNCNGPTYAVAENGDFFVLAWYCGGFWATYEGNVFVQAGRPQDVLVTLARGDCVQFAYASTANGDIYRKRSGWEYIGNIAGKPVPAERTSLGDLKSRYH